MSNEELIDLAIDQAINNQPEMEAIDYAIDKLVDEEESSAIDAAIDQAIEEEDTSIIDSAIDQAIEEDNGYKLSNEDLDSIVEVLEENANTNEDIKRMRDIVGNETPETLNDEEVVGEVTYDNETGAVVNAHEVESETREMKTADLSLSDLVDNYEPTSLPILDDEIKKQFSEDMNLSDSDIAQLLNVLHRHQSGEKFNAFNILPDSIKDIIRKSAAELGLSGRDQINFFTKTMLDQFITDAQFNKEVVDFEEALKKELNIPSLVDLHAEYTREAMEKEMLENADKFEAAGAVEKAEALRRVSAAFTSSYTYDKVYKVLETNRKVRSRLAKDIEKYKSFCNDFVYKFRDTQFNIHDIALCAKTLKRVMTGRSDEEIIMFVNCVWKSIEPLDTSVLENNIYAYYVIKNIMALDYTEADAKTDFTNEVIHNIDLVMDKINEYVQAKAEYDAKVEEERKAKKGKGKKK